MNYEFTEPIEKAAVEWLSKMGYTYAYILDKIISTKMRKNKLLFQYTM